MTQLLLNIVMSTSILLLCCVSFSIIFNATKFFNLAHSSIISIGAYLTFLCMNQFRFSTWVSVPIAILCSALVGLATELLVYKRMRKSKLPAYSFMIASLGLFVVLQNCLVLLFGDDTKVIRTTGVEVGKMILGAYITTVQIATVLISISLFIVTTLFLNFTLIGKSIRAVSNNPELSTIHGISSDKIILTVFGLGSALGAITGILSAFDTNMTPGFGFNLLLYAVVAMIIGGVGNTKGIVVGALIVATGQQLSSYYLDTKWMDAATYTILILFLIWKPLGFSGNRLRKVQL